MSTEGLKVSVHQGIFVHRYVKLLKFLSKNVDLRLAKLWILDLIYDMVSIYIFDGMTVKLTIQPDSKTAAVFCQMMLMYSPWLYCHWRLKSQLPS